MKKQAKMYELPQKKDGKTYTYFQVVWYDQSGKRCRKTFNDRSEAFRFASHTNTELINQGNERRMLSTILTEPLLRKAEFAFERLGDRYDLDAAIAFS